MMLKRIFTMLAFFAALSLSAQTYFGQASTPADNGTNSTSVVSVTPPASMAAGDLVILACQARFNGTTVVVDNTGGQTWQFVNAAVAGTNHTLRLIWCRFNGAWAADPSISFGSALSTTVSMHVFRPGTASNTWMIDRAPEWAVYAAPANPFTVTRPGQTSVGNNVVALSVLLSTDDNTWVEVPSDWELSGVQYRNQGGLDQSHVVGYRILAAAGTASTDFSCRQSSLGGDNGSHIIVLFQEVPITNRGFFGN